MPEIAMVNVFTLEERGGNPTPVVLEASGYDEAAMLAVARRFNLESVFIFPPTRPDAADFRFRFFVPRQEMSMCGHGTIGALWLLQQEGRLAGSSVRIETQSGPVRGRVGNPGAPTERIEIGQPAGRVAPVVDPHARRAVLDVLGVSEEGMRSLPILNAVTSRMKTLVPLRSVELLDALAPDFRRMESVCASLDSTGLYPFAVRSQPERLYEARQFPKASGFPEDAATGVAAAALLFGLRHYDLIPDDDRAIRVRQGRAMGRPSEISARCAFGAGADRPTGCWIGGAVSRVG